MIPRRRRLSRRQRRDRLVLAAQVAGLQAIVGGLRGPANLREDLFDAFRRRGFNPDPLDFILPRPLALAERVAAEGGDDGARPPTPPAPRSRPAPA